MLAVLFEDEELLVVDKPAGLPAQPGEKVGHSVLSIVQRDRGFVPLPLHRLDKETAGCMALAKTAAAASRFAALFAAREVGKFYKAVCAGQPLQDKGVYSDALVVAGKTLRAATRYRCLARFGARQDASLDARPGEAPPYSLLELELESGRTHQIRRHMAMHGHPVLGDDKYGDFALNRSLKKSAGLKHLLLWAWKLQLPGYSPLFSALPPHFAEFLGRWPDAPSLGGF